MQIRVSNTILFLCAAGGHTLHYLLKWSCKGATRISGGSPTTLIDPLSSSYLLRPLALCWAFLSQPSRVRVFLDLLPLLGPLFSP